MPRWNNSKCGFQKGVPPWNKNRKGIFFIHKQDCKCCSCKSKRGEYNGKNSPNYKGRESNKCLDCGKEISWVSKRCFKCSQQERTLKMTETRRKQGKINHKEDCPCSFCRGKRGENSLENHYNWQGGKSFEPYPLGWTKTYKEQVRFRDGYKCQICGIPEVECKKKLHVHHKDYNKKNISINNLISLCHSCHIKTNYNREYWIKYFDYPYPSMTVLLKRWG
jgi:hypothetical protein